MRVELNSHHKFKIMNSVDITIGSILGVILLTFCVYLAIHLLPFIALFIIVFLAIKIKKFF